MVTCPMCMGIDVDNPEGQTLFGPIRATMTEKELICMNEVAAVWALKACNGQNSSGSFPLYPGRGQTVLGK